MTLHEFPRLGERYWEQRLENGLLLRVVPKPGFARSYAFLGVDYGSIDTSFTRGGVSCRTPDGVVIYVLVVSVIHLGLRRDGQLGGQRLLRQISGNAKLADLFPDLHVRFLRSKSCSAAFWIQHTTRRAKRKAPRERERATGRRVSRGGTDRA